MLIVSNLHKKSSEVSIKTRSPPALLSIKDQATKHTTVKWSINTSTIRGLLRKHTFNYVRSNFVFSLHSSMIRHVIFDCKCECPSTIIHRFSIDQKPRSVSVVLHGIVVKRKRYYAPSNRSETYTLMHQ